MSHTLGAWFNRKVRHTNTYFRDNVLDVRRSNNNIPRLWEHFIPLRAADGGYVIAVPVL